MKKERKTIGAALLRVNEGQVDWLPKNPREWRKEDMEKMRRSIREDPDFLEDRPALVVPHGKGYVIFCGNFRTEGARAEGITDIPCVVYRPETDEDRMTVIRRAMKDNGSYGRFDWDILADEWDNFPLEDWGVPVWDAGKDEEATGGAGVAAAREDDFDEDKDEIHVRCKRGDIWQLGDHRITCGDSVDLEVVKSVMGGVWQTC